MTRRQAEGLALVQIGLPFEGLEFGVRIERDLLGKRGSEGLDGRGRTPVVILGET